MSIFNADSETDASAVAADVVQLIAEQGDAALVQFADTIARGLANTWQPQGTTPAHILAAMGTRAKTFFDESAAAINYLWISAARRNVFLSSCAQHGVQCSVAPDGLPVFAQRLAATTHADGTVTLNP